MTSGLEPAGEGAGLDMALRTVLIVGSGLMGTSVGLALRSAGIEVFLEDVDPAAALLAQELGAGLAQQPPDGVDLVVLAVPPTAVANGLERLERLHVQATFTDLASVKSQPQAQIQSMKIDRSRFVGGHPLAGRERSGAAAARGDLFEGRPWVLTPSEDTGDLALARATELVRLCGAQLVVMSPARHDQAVALISHVPQVLATLAAARLADADADLVTLSGQGVRDVTRIAASDTGLWTEILSANARCVLPVLDEVAADLDAVRAALRIINSSLPRQVAESINVHGHAVREGSQALDDDAATGVLADLLRQGNEGYRRIPGKHGTAPATYVGVPVVVPDRPGELARLLVACGEAQVNVEDVSIEHSLGQPVGLVEIAVRPAAAQGLADALRERGWSVHF